MSPILHILLYKLLGAPPSKKVFLYLVVCRLFSLLFNPGLPPPEICLDALNADERGSNKYYKHNKHLPMDFKKLRMDGWTRNSVPHLRRLTLKCRIFYRIGFIYRTLIFLHSSGSHGG